MGDESVVEHAYIDGSNVDKLYSALGHDGALGTEANFMFHWFQPHENASMSQVKALIIERFVVVGDTAQLPLFVLMLAKLRNQDLAKAYTWISKLILNPSSHKSVLDVLSEAEYIAVANRHRLDIELYYWAVQQVKALTECFDDTGDLRSILCAKK